MSLIKRALFRDRTEATLFVTSLFIRAAFLAVVIHFGIKLDHDNERYDQQSTAMLQGDFDLETRFFISAPMYPAVQAVFKLVFGSAWLPAITVVQLLLAAFSSVALYRLAGLLFDRRVAVLAAAIYTVFPFTLIWVGTASQDMPFQLALIFALHALIKAVRSGRMSDTVVGALLFSITFLIKSHILLFAPFIPVYWWLNAQGSALARALRIGAFAAICFTTTIPFGLYNLHRHGVYVISSTGLGGHFLTGHNEDVYRFIVAPPPLGSPEHRRIFNMDYLVMREINDTLATLDHKGKQALYLSKGLEWCRENPGKVLELSLYDLFYFLLPGVNPHHYGTMSWLGAFLLCLPLYLLAYAGMAMALHADLRKHLWILGLFLSMIAFSVGFYVQNRFRTITLEPFYIIYAAFAVLRLARRLGLERRWPVLAPPVEA